MVSRRGRLGELAKSFDLRALTERVLAGALSLEAARAEIAAMNAARVADARPLEQLPDGTLLVLAKVQEDIDALVQELAREEKATRVHDLGVLVCDAAPLLTPGYIIFPCVVVAQRLITLDRAAWAFEFLDRADPVASVPSEGYSRLQTLRTECLLNLGKGTEAAATIAPVIDYARAEAKTGLLVEALMRLGRALSVSGRVDRALAAAREAAAVFDRPGYVPMRWSGAVKSWEIHGLIAHTERALGHFEEALSAYERARADALAAGNVGGAAFFLSEVGYTWQVAGDLERGREILNRAAGEAYELGALGFAARWSGTMPPPPLEANEPPLDKATRAITLMKSTPPRLDEARKLLIEALEPAVGGGDKLVELVVRTALTNLYVEQGKYMQAEIAALEAIEVAHEMGNVGAELRARLNLAHVHVQRKRRADAEAVLEEAVALGERVRTTARSAEMRQTIGAVLAEGYEWLAFLAGIQYAANADAEWEPVRPARLFELGQRTRALNLARWIELGERVGPMGAAPRQALLDLLTAEVQLESLAEEGRGRLDDALALRNGAEERLHATAGVAVELATPPVQMMTEMVETLDRGAVYLDVFSLEEGVAFNLFSAAGVIDAGIWPGRRRERIALIERWRSTSLQAARATFSGKAAPTWLLSDLAALDTQLDDQFFNYLRSRLDPVETPTRFIVFPHRELFQLPFWRLTTSRPDLPVSVLPGVNVAPLLARRDRTSPGPLVACGDATSQLAHVETELQRLPPHTVCDPSPAAILGAWPQARTIHFAGHGHFDTDNPYKSGLIAAGVPDSSDPLVASHDALPGCQLLTIGWILGRLRLDHCQLAVLSACYTGLPRTHPASEFTSLPAALIVAGARNVVASLWPAHDGATRLLMTEFYAALESESPSQALARARRRLGTMTRDEIVTQLGSDRGLPPGERPFESPFYTDAFQHYGVD